MEQDNEPQDYIINIKIGTPPQTVGCYLDTGSADLWVRAASTCPNSTACPLGSFNPNESTTYVPSDQPFTIAYADLNLTGITGHDSVGFGNLSGPNMTVQVIADPEVSYVPIPGDLGISFAAQEAAVQQTPYKNATSKSNPTITDILTSAGAIKRNGYGIYLGPLTDGQGQITFGGVDTAKYTGDLIALPAQVDVDSGILDRLQVAMTSLSITDNSANGKSSFSVTPSDYSYPASFDTGTVGGLIEPSIFNKIVEAIGAIPVPGADYVLVPCSFGNNTSITFDVQFGGPDGPTIQVPLSDMVYQKWVVETLRGTDMCSLAMQSTEGLYLEAFQYMILGDTFIRNMYILVDFETNHVAIAQANYTTDTNIVALPAQGPIPQVASTNTYNLPITYTRTTTSSVPTPAVETTVVPTPSFTPLASPSAATSSTSSTGKTISSLSDEWRTILAFATLLLSAVV